MMALALALQISGGCYQVDNETRCDSFAGGLIASAPRETADDLASAKSRAAAKRADKAEKLIAAGHCDDARRLAAKAEDAPLLSAVSKVCVPSPSR